MCWVFVAAQALSLVVVSGGYSLIALGQLLTAVASPVAEHRLSGSRASVVAACGLSSGSSQASEHRLTGCGGWA